MTLPRWLAWPSTRRNSLLPWPVFAWRLIWTPMLLLVTCAYFLVVLVVFGQREARDAWRWM